ncbi:MAG: alanine--glyoxylate aminotransferase family protein [Candidatus Eisenbacteria bacterium]
MDKENRTFLSLFTPGPVDISDEARDGLQAPLVHHRSDLFEEILTGLINNLKNVLQTEDDVAVLTSSGTGAMEAVVTNLLSPGDEVLVPVAGKFSGRWAEICAACGVEIRRMDLEPGECPAPGQVVDALRRNTGITTVFLTHCETSTGSLTDVRAVAEAVCDLERSEGREILTCVDCTSSLCVDELRKDDWRIDCAIGASQKGLLAPPGLAFVCMNDRALGRMAVSTLPKYYFDLRKYYDGHSAAPFTPAVSLVCAAKASLDRIISLGLERVWKACRSSATAVTIIMETAGLRPVAAQRSNAVRAFWMEDLNPEEVSGILRNRHGIVVAGGQLDLKGKILRVSAIGKTRSEVLDFAKAFEATMAEVGRPFTLGDIADELDAVLEESSIWE